MSEVKKVEGLERYTIVSPNVPYGDYVRFDQVEAIIAVKDARVKKITDALSNVVVINEVGHYVNDAVAEHIKDIETQLAAAKKALEPFAKAAEMALISGNPPGNHVDANCFLEALNTLEETK